jgi:hypothetical protein
VDAGSSTLEEGAALCMSHTPYVMLGEHQGKSCIETPHSSPSSALVWDVCQWKSKFHLVEIKFSV